MSKGNKLNSSANSVSERIDVFSLPSQSASERLQNSLSGFSAMQEQMEKLTVPGLLVSEQLRKSFSGFSTMQEQLAKLSTHSNFHEFGAFSISDASGFSFDELERLNDEVLEIQSKSLSENEFINTCLVLSETKSEAVKLILLKILYYLIFPYFLSIVANITTPYYLNTLTTEQPTSARDIKKEINTTAYDLYSFSELKEYRFVSASTLNIRNRGAKNSEIIGELYEGNVVRLLRKSKNTSWSYIEYQDLDGSIREGWLFSRYLEKFKFRR